MIGGAYPSKPPCRDSRRRFSDSSVHELNSHKEPIISLLPFLKLDSEMVCVSSTLAMLVSIYVCQTNTNLLNGEPGRVAAQVLTGIGFIGAGHIRPYNGGYCCESCDTYFITLFQFRNNGK